MTDGASREAVVAALQDAHRFYRRQVGDSWVPDHLNRRNLYAQLGPAAIGYAPPGWTATVDALRRQGYSDATLTAAGLARPASSGNVIDVFRDRLMVPLSTPAGELVGFIGRASAAAGPHVPKYLNTPATAVFAKHELLYGLSEDSDALRRGAMPILVEGPMDRLAVRQAAPGLRVAALAPCGTALGAEQVAALLEVVGPRRPIAVALDADAGGRAATLRAWDMLTAAGARNLLHVSLPVGKDPADLVRSGRGDRLRSAIAHNRPLALAVADQRIAAAGGRPGDWQRGLMVARQVCRADLHRVPVDQVGRYVTHLAQRLQLDAELVTVAATDAVAAGPPSITRSAGSSVRELAIPPPPRRPHAERSRG